jgi:anti-sigma factor RsiW
MSCSPFDLKEYFLQELPDPQRLQVEAHIKNCHVCREELDRLSVTQAALLSLRDEEIPQRIAFVSDKVFEPSPWRRWLAAFWSSGARLGFASAAMLSAAILFSALTRPAPAPAPVPQPVIAGMTSAEVDQRIQAAVTKAVAESETRQEQKTTLLVKDIEHRAAEESRLKQIALSENEYLERENIGLKRVAGDYGPPAGNPGDAQ